MQLYPKRLNTPLRHCNSNTQLADTGIGRVLWLINRRIYRSNKLLYILVMGLLSSTAGLCVMARAYGHLHAFPELNEFGVSPCGISICFRGMVPGQTSWIAMQTAAPLPPNKQQNSRSITTTSSRATIYRSLDGLSVGAIAITIIHSGNLTIGDIVGQYGNPCLVDILLYPEHLIVLRYRGANFSAQIADRRISSDLPIRYIDLLSTGYVCSSPKKPCSRHIDLLRLHWNDCFWQGFTWLRHYTDES